MTIQDTHLKCSKTSKHFLTDHFKKYGNTKIFVDEQYKIKEIGPMPGDRYYFRVKLKHK